MTTNSEPIRVAIVDDNTGFRRGLQTLLQTLPGFAIIGEAANGTDALALIRTHQPHVVLMDIELPVDESAHNTTATGINITRRLYDELPHIRVVMLSWHYKNAYIAAALRAGAAGYVVKGGDQAQLIRAVTAAVHGDFFVGREIVPKFREVVSSVLDARTIGDLFAAEKLTTTESTVLSLIARNFSNEQIATELHLASQTVRNYVSSILSKMAVPDRQAAQNTYRQRVQSFGFDVGEV